jgi:hypothetical protein
MKTKEEIEQLHKEVVKLVAEIAFKDELIKSNQNINWIGYGKGIDGTSKEKWLELFIKGYTQSQEDMADKKYTEEDMLKSFWAGVDCEADNGKNFEQFINSLNKQD